MRIHPSGLRDNFLKMKDGDGYRQALSTGFVNLDPYIKLAKGYLMINTGYPSSGKSEFLDAILINMSLMHNWKTMYFSPENYPTEEHMAKLAEKFTGTNLRSMTPQEDKKALDFLQSHYTWMDMEDPYLEKIMRLAEDEHVDNGLDCLVIDPWNNVFHDRGHLREDEYLSECLGKVLRFARTKKILIAVVAHPKNPVKDKDGNYPTPDLYCIAGGAMWRNKADYGVCYHRPSMSKHEIEVMVQKIKQKWMGKVGSQLFDYDLRSGRFKQKDAAGFYLPTDVEPPF